MRCSDLPWLIQFIVMFYNDKPGDWLLDGMMETKACNLEKDQVSTWAELGTELLETEICLYNIVYIVLSTIILIGLVFKNSSINGITTRNGTITVNLF